MNKLLKLFSFIFLLNSCVPEAKNNRLTYKNIIILTDLSSRISNSRFPNKDLKRIHEIINEFKNEVKPGDKIGDRSRLYFSTFSNQTPSFEIDIEKYNNSLDDKQAFVNSTGKFSQNGLTNRLLNFKDSIALIYNTIKNPGLDLISLLIEKIENEPIIKKERVIPFGIDKTIINYENEIYIFTDGYLEYSNNINKEFYFGTNQIDKIRKFCNVNNVDVSTALKMDKTLGLIPYNKENNKYINLHILETHERDKDPKLLVYNNNVGFRDNEILEQVWAKWAKESGFKSFSWAKY